MTCLVTGKKIAKLIQHVNCEALLIFIIMLHEIVFNQSTFYHIQITYTYVYLPCSLEMTFIQKTRMENTSTTTQTSVQHGR